MSDVDPDARCGSCGVRLAGVDRDHEDRCSREADGWPPFEDAPIHRDSPLSNEPELRDAA